MADSQDAPNARRPEARARRIGAFAFLTAGVVFLLVPLLGDGGSDAVFLVLGLAFVMVSLNFWRS